MATTSPASPPASSLDRRGDQDADGDKDWPARATEAIVTQVELVRSKTTGPVLKGVRYAVFGFFALSLGTVALIILLIGTVRALDNYLPDAVFGESHTWAAHTILGIVFLVPGVVLYNTRAKAKPED